MSEIRSALRGHSIVDIYLDHSKTTLAIVIGGSDYMVSVLKIDTDGDCCSHSWIEHITNAEACHMARFSDWYETNIEPSLHDMSDADKRQYGEGELKFYFYGIRTDKGECVIEMRNSSNGYYGGSLVFRGSVPFLDFDFSGFKLATEL